MHPLICWGVASLETFGRWSLVVGSCIRLGVSVAVTGGLPEKEQKIQQSKLSLRPDFDNLESIRG